MKIVYTEGCTVTGLTVDKEDFVSLSEEKQKDILKKIIDKADMDILPFIATDLLQQAGEYRWLYHCDQCGDDVCEYTITIE